MSKRLPNAQAHPPVDSPGIKQITQATGTWIALTALVGGAAPQDLLVDPSGLVFKALYPARCGKSWPVSQGETRAVMPCKYKAGMSCYVLHPAEPLLLACAVFLMGHHTRVSECSQPAELPLAAQEAWWPHLPEKMLACRRSLCGHCPLCWHSQGTQRGGH